MREGFWPVPGRKQLLQSPIWHDPRVATSPDHGGKMFFLWREKGYQQAIGTTNVQPANQLKDATGSYNPGGLLQWMDLDLMMFLSALFTDRQDKVIDADQRNIFNAIGYQRLDDPPYQELRSSIKRLTGTQLWEFEETAQGEIQYRTLPPRSSPRIRKNACGSRMVVVCGWSLRLDQVGSRRFGRTTKWST